MGGGVLFGAKPRISDNKLEDIRQMLRLMEHDIESAKTATYAGDDLELQKELDNLSASFFKYCESGGFFHRILEGCF